MKGIFMNRLILASRSPRRNDLLKLIAEGFEVIPSNFDEESVQANSPQELVEILSEQKAKEVQKKHPHKIVLGSDTVVSLDGKVLLIPKSTDEAKQMLRSLSGKTHQVFTGVSIVSSNNTHTFCSTTDVTFFDLTDDEIDTYVKSGDAMDKAGAYGIQSGGALFVKSISGDYTTVVGLPIGLVKRKLKEHFDIG